MIGIIHYGLGNIKAFANVYKRLGMPFRIASTPEELGSVSKIVLPGVGAFDGAMDMLNRSGLRPMLEELVLGRGVPVLGVCVGMQMLARSSEEGALSGLGWIRGEVRKLGKKSPGGALRLPHMGWNGIVVKKDTGLTRGLSEDSRFYFLHSYYLSCEDPADVLMETEYGDSFTCAVSSGNVYGVQFHPEKSHSDGARLLRNFGEL